MITDSGLVIKRLADILNEYNSEFDGLLGENTDVSPTSPLGQIIGVMAERESLIWSLAEGLYSSQYPEFAFKRSLDLAASITGTIRRQATRSTISNGIARGDDGTTVPHGTIISTSEDTRFETLEDATINIADGATFKSSSIPMRAIDTGPLKADIGTLTNIITPVSGMDSFTNETAAVLGTNQEKDSELKLRRNRELNAAGVATIGAIQAALSRRDLVTSVQVFENRDSITDIDGRPPHSIEAMIQGDHNQALGEALFNAAPAGVAFFGNQSVTVLDSEGVEQVVRFSRPIVTNLFVNFSIQVNNEYPPDGDSQIKNQVEKFGESLQVAQSIILYGSRALICVIDDIPGITSAQVTIGRSADALFPNVINIGKRELPRIPEANVTVSKN